MLCRPIGLSLGSAEASYVSKLLHCSLLNLFLL